MAFLIDTQELKPGLIIFRRADVQHRRWYCRIKIPETDRYKTIALKTTDAFEARTRAYDHDADIRFRIKHQIPVFEKSFGEVCEEYADHLKKQAEAGLITRKRWKIVDGYVRLHLKPYAGTVQILHMGDDHWNGYPVWRRSHHAPDEAKESYGPRRRRASGERVTTAPKEAKPRTPPKDGTIRQEMAAYLGVMNFAARKNYIRENQVPKSGKPKDTGRRDAFSLTEYRTLHTTARNKWVVEKGLSQRNSWYRQMTYLYMLVMTNTGMRTIEARTLRWKKIELRKDASARTIVVISVRGKKKHRELVAAANVADYLDRIKEISPATNPDDFVFCNYDGKQCINNYDEHVASMLTFVGLRHGDSGSLRSAYSFRHTYATFRLMEGVDGVWLAQQMGTSVQMIEDHYGHIAPSKNAERVLQGMPDWDRVVAGVGTALAADVDAAKPAADKPDSDV